MSDAIQADNLPRHVAVIMDGNGRWAEGRGLGRVAGHQAGVEAVREVVRCARSHGIRHLTLFAFSTENWNRPRVEVDELMALLRRYLGSELDELIEHQVRVRAIGAMARLPGMVRRRLERVMDATKDHDGMDLVFALSYGGRAEIVEAARQLSRDVERGEVDPEQIDEKMFAAYLYAPDLPDPDLLIRTGGESRISNFLLWQLAYSELHVTPVMWPDFSACDFESALEVYQRRERRYGLTGAQVRNDGQGGSSA